MPTSSAGAPWGASVSDWEAWQRLGLTADILPTVSDPNAVISARSKMKDKGKTPSLFNSNGHVVGMLKWTQHRTTEREVERWCQDSRLGICLQTRVVKAIDIDIADSKAAQAVYEALVFGLGLLPCRSRGNSGKMALIFKLAADFPKRVIRSEQGIIELLSTGQQLVVCGTHPSGVRYEWAGGVPTEIPELTMAELEVAWQALIEQYALPDGVLEVRNGKVPAVPRTVLDLQDSTVAWLDENGWVTGHNRDGRVDIRCPFADGHSVDTGASSTSYFPAGVGGFQQGHYRCLHASCAGRSDGDFARAIGIVASEFDAVETVAGATEKQPLPPFTRDRAGRIEAELNNVLMMLRRHDVLGYRVGFDQFKCALMISEGEAWRPFNDNDYTMLRSVMTGMGFKEIKSDTMKDAVKLVGEERCFDSAVQWAESLVWDGVERIDTFYSDYFGVADSPYTRAVAKYTWTGLAGRCSTHPLKCDMVPVFIGLQGVGKTMAVESFAPIPNTFVELNLEKKDDDLARLIRGKLVAEIAELRGLQGRDSESIKAWISRKTEEWTPKYREFNIAYDRRCLFFGTGNNQHFLDDATGERRWLPMLVGKVDIAGILAVRDQLWAEAVHRFWTVGLQWQEAYDLAPAEHKSFKVSDLWEDMILDWISTEGIDGPRGPYVRSADLLLGACRLQANQLNKANEMRLGRVMSKLGFPRKVVWRHGRNARYFVVSCEFA